MSGDLLKSVSDGPKIQLLEKQQAARSVLISNISPQTDDGEVVIHFQRQKNGGGEIDNMFIPKKGTAVITFDSSEVVETVLKHSHTLNGSALKISRFIPDNPPEIFQRVSARVNFDKLQLSPQQSKEALKLLKDKTEIECPGVIEKECVLSGTFTQIENAQKLLQGIFLRRSSVPQPSQGRSETFRYDDTTQTQGNSSESWDTEVGDDGVSSLEVQPQFMKLFKRVYKMKLQEIEEEHGVEIVWNENESHVQLHPSTRSSSPQSYQKGCDAFIDLYQNCFPNMCREEIELKNADDGVLETINSVEAENDVVIEKVGNKLVVYAEKNKITSSVQALKETLGLSKSGRKTRRSQKSTNLGAREHSETIQEDRFSALPAPFLQQFLSNEVKFSLSQGDITDERVDAIVNAANEWLSHGGGVAAAIVRKGGRQMEEESRGIMLKRNRRPLDVGDAVHTKGGKLPCRFVIHTVGPRWSEYERNKSISLLNRACVESLRLTAELELSSIALPAISSGIFGMPKDICAQVMFKAIEEFSSSTDAEFSTLRDVRIVIIDDETINVFREEFVKRYPSQETSPPNLPHEEMPTNKEREVALKTSLELPPISSADDPSAQQSKKRREEADFKTPTGEVGSDVKSSNKRKVVLDGVKEVCPSFLKQFLSNGVNLSLYKSDIIDQQVDAIVNAAHEWLSHGAGVAAAIVGKGGRQIEEESRRIMAQRNWWPLNVGDAVHTSGGNLPCRFVIHTVGPKWSAYDRKKSISLLNRACVESLRLAAELELSSIALPAICSGVFGMPKDICAQVMFKAIEEFSSSTDAEFSTLRDVRIVIIDDETINVFQEEFVKRYPSQETSPPNLPHEEMPTNKEREVALKTSLELPPFSSADDPTAQQSKKGREEADFKTPNDGVGSKEKSSDKPKEVLDGIKQVHPLNNDIPNTKEASQLTGIKRPDVETEANGKNKETGLEVTASVGRSEPSNINNAARKLSGRGRGLLAAYLSGKQQRQPGSNSNGGSEVPEKGETRNVDAGRGRGMTYATTSTSPPGLTVTDEGRRLAQDLGKQVKDNLNTDPVVSINVKVDAEENGSSNEASKEDNKESKHNNRKRDGVKLDGGCPQGHSGGQKISRHSQLGEDDASKSKLAPDDGMTDSQETEKATTLATDRGSKPLTSMDKPNQAKSEEETRIQVDQPSSDAKNTETTYPEHLLPPYQSGTSSETKEVIPKASHGSVNEQDILEGRRTAEVSTVHTPAADGALLYKMHGVHQPSEKNCVMCMNLSKSPVFPLQCGHHFCKSCLNWFTEKTKNCPKCVQENLSQGDQPIGYMTWRTDSHDSLSGYEEFGTIVITYNFQDGIQGPEHPNPEEPYCGLFCSCYLPNSPAGQELGNLLRRAFDERLIFTIGKCPATGEENKIVWNGIELKTSRSGGPANYGYPDPSYLDRAKRQLAEKGILTQQHDQSNQ